MRRFSWLQIGPLGVVLGACAPHDDPEPVIPGEEEPVEPEYVDAPTIPDAEPLPEPEPEPEPVPVVREERRMVPMSRVGPNWRPRSRNAAQRVRVKKQAKKQAQQQQKVSK